MLVEDASWECCLVFPLRLLRELDSYRWSEVPIYDREDEHTINKSVHG